jgi:hypothetical protein
MNVPVFQDLDEIALGERFDELADLVGHQAELAASADDVDRRRRPTVLGDPSKETAFVVVVSHDAHGITLFVAQAAADRRRARRPPSKRAKSATIPLEPAAYQRDIDDGDLAEWSVSRANRP